MYYSEKGDELKKFNTRDGMGLGLLRQHGILTAIITGENVGLVVTRANKMKIDYVYCGIKNKLETLEKIINQENLTFDQVAYIGDDINDLEVMKKVGLSFAVNDAMDIIKKNAHYVTQLRGGQGAVREVCEMILEAQISS
jgi:N-acylneuraminate cytidylyltransferase